MLANQEKQHRDEETNALCTAQHNSNRGIHSQLDVAHAAFTWHAKQ